MIKKQYRILIVEDEDSARENFVSYLSMFYDEIYEAKNGEIALQLYKEKKPDIILLDLNIPKIGGLDVARSIRENDINTKIIVLTAHSEKSFLLEAISLKLTKYLLKPVNRKDLKDAFEIAINEIGRFDIVSSEVFKIDESYTYDFAAKCLKYKENIVEITAKERMFLEYLLKNRTRVCSYDELIEEINSSSYDGLKNLVKRFKKKLENELFINIASLGYKISL